MKWTIQELRELYIQIRATWRWHHHYTAIFEDGQKYRTGDRDSIPSEGLIAIYNGYVTMEQLEEDLSS